MSDIVERLRRLPEPQCSSCKAAADEIERLRLTDAERGAVAYYIGTGGPHAVDDTLRCLLERLGGER